ncbi:hypothetical protein Godav_010164 [Gossypium davidsonii]|uniref:Uncharacterized protein n=2 Tax=Gossypium TaxID=3633 RepID=A0A7J8SFJ2_GOSDV|nr:hypothetical protein [Gossypium davidsonii]MBA0660447.1 hypothetical protein [Gossypium klotzschianum]
MSGFLATFGNTGSQFFRTSVLKI